MAIQVNSTNIGTNHDNRAKYVITHTHINFFLVSKITVN